MADIEFFKPGGVARTPNLQQVTDEGKITTNWMETPALNLTGCTTIIGDGGTYVCTENDTTLIVDLTVNGKRIDLGALREGHILAIHIIGAAATPMADSRTCTVFATGGVINNLLEVQMRTLNESAIYHKVASNRIYTISPTTRTATGIYEVAAYAGGVISIRTNLGTGFYAFGTYSFWATPANSITASLFQLGWYGNIEAVPSLIQITTLSTLPPFDLKLYWGATWRPNT